MIRRLPIPLPIPLIIVLLLVCALGAAAARPAATAAPSPAPALAPASDAVHVQRLAGGTLQLTLDPGLGTSWREADVRRVAVRSAGGQVQVPLDRLGARARAGSGAGPGVGAFEVAASAESCSLVLANFGPAPDARRTGPEAALVTRTAKIVSCPEAASPGARRARLRSGGVLAAQTGGPLELQPLLNPATVRPGKDLAVRALVRGTPVVAQRISATLLGQGGSASLSLDAWTGPEGIAVFTLPRSGRWLIRFRPLGGAAFDGSAEATLSFTVEPDAFWGRPDRDRPDRSRRGAGLAERDGESASETAPVGAAAWHPLGPAPIDEVEWSGRIADLAVSPSAPDRYVAAAASGGVWRTESGGTSWQEVGDGLPTLVTGAVAIDPHDDQVIYVGSGEAHSAYHSLYGLGVYKSTDGGISWQVLGTDVFEGRTIARLAVSPLDSQVVWAAVGRAGGGYDKLEGAKLHPDRLGPVGLFRSDDGGVTWAPASTTLPPIPANDIDFDPVDPSRMYVTFSDVFGDLGNGIYLSTDAGQTFHRIFFTHNFGRCELAIAPSDPNRLYLLATTSIFKLYDWGGYHPAGGYTVGVWRSDDGGFNWTYHYPGSFTGGQGDYDLAVAVDPHDPDTVFLGGVAMLRSRDGGISWSDVTPPHADVHQVRFDAADRLLAATDGGVYRSADLGDSWQVHNRHLGSIQFYPGISADPVRRGRLLGGAQDNGTLMSDDSGRDWRWIHGGDGGYTAIHPEDPEVVFVEYQGVGNLFRSDDGGISFELLDLGLDPYYDATAFQAPFALDPSDPDRILYGSRRVSESTDRGETWTTLSADLTGTDVNVDASAIRSLVIAPSNDQTVYATTNNQRLLVSVDGGVTWDLRREDVYGWPRIARQIAVDPLDDATAYVAIGRFGGDKVLATHDRGATWTSLGAGLPDLPVNCVAVDRSGGDRRIFAGTDRGVFWSADDGVTWSLFGQNLPAAPVVDLMVDTAHHRLVAATLGRGMWETPLVD